MQAQLICSTIMHVTHIAFLLTLFVQYGNPVENVDQTDKIIERLTALEIAGL